MGKCVVEAKHRAERGRVKTKTEKSETKTSHNQMIGFGGQFHTWENGSFGAWKRVESRG